jgi:hypothetical protein
LILGEILIRNQQVAGSIPSGGSINFKDFQPIAYLPTYSERLPELPIASFKATGRSISEQWPE